MGKHLDEFPNVMTEFGAVIAEFGRQPKTARKFFIDYQDRILFGKDLYKRQEENVKAKNQNCHKKGAKKNAGDMSFD